MCYNTNTLLTADVLPKELFAAYSWMQIKSQGYKFSANSTDYVYLEEDGKQTVSPRGTNLPSF